MEVSGVTCPEDLFGDLGYWPKEEVWTGSEKTLDQLLEKLTEANASNKRKVREFLVRYFEDYADAVEDADLRATYPKKRRRPKRKAGCLHCG